jgi:hypothetical protein
MIWDLITGFLPDVWPYLLAIGGVVVAWLSGRSSGAAKAKKKQAEAQVKTMKQANEVRDAVDAKSDAAVRGDLSRWVRPD